MLYSKRNRIVFSSAREGRHT